MTTDFANTHPAHLRTFNVAVEALDEAIRRYDHSQKWQTVVMLSLLAHFREITSGAMQDMVFGRPAAAKILARGSLETTYQIVALMKDAANFDKLAYKSVASRLSSIKKWSKSVADDAMKTKAAQPIEDLEKHLVAESANRLETIFEVAKLAGMEHDYRTDYALLSNYTHADLETILRDRVRINESEDRFEVSFENLNPGVAEVVALLVFQHVCVLEALGEVQRVPELGAYLDDVAGNL